MTTKAIKISEENYVWLIEIASDIQKKEGRNISIDETLSYIKEIGRKASANILLGLAGTWKMNEKEAENFKKDLKKGWKKWKKHV